MNPVAPPETRMHLLEVNPGRQVNRLPVGVAPRGSRLGVLPGSIPEFTVEQRIKKRHALSWLPPGAMPKYPAHRCVRISAQQGSLIRAASVYDEGEHRAPLNRHTKKMAFTPHMPTAARRHLEAAEILFGHGSRLDVSGYLYGIAAECAVKAFAR